jgi:hypothetical protein
VCAAAWSAIRDHDRPCQCLHTQVDTDLRDTNLWIGVPNTLDNRIKFPSTPRTRKLSGIMKSHQMMLRVCQWFGKRAPRATHAGGLGAPIRNYQGKKTNQPKGPACVYTRSFFQREVLSQALTSGSLAKTFMHHVPASGTSGHMPVETHISSYQFHAESAGLELGSR